MKIKLFNFFSSKADEEHQEGMKQLDHELRMQKLLLELCKTHIESMSRILNILNEYGESH